MKRKRKLSKPPSLHVYRVILEGPWWRSQKPIISTGLASSFEEARKNAERENPECSADYVERIGVPWKRPGEPS